MSVRAIKSQLIKLGTTNPKLRPHIRKILAYDLPTNKEIAKGSNPLVGVDTIRADLKVVESVIKRMGYDIQKGLKADVLMEASTSSIRDSINVINEFLSLYDDIRFSYKGQRNVSKSLQLSMESMKEELSDRTGKTHSYRALVRDLSMHGVSITFRQFGGVLDAGKAKGLLSGLGLDRKDVEAIRDSAEKSVEHYTRYKDAVLLRISKAFLDGATSLVGRQQVPDSDADVPTADLITRYFSDMKDFWKRARTVVPERAEKTAQSVLFIARTGFNYEDTQDRSDIKKGGDVVVTLAKRMMAQYPEEFQGRVRDISPEWAGDDRFRVLIRFK